MTNGESGKTVIFSMIRKAFFVIPCTVARHVHGIQSIPAANRFLIKELRIHHVRIHHDSLPLVEHKIRCRWIQTTYKPYYHEEMYTYMYTYTSIKKLTITRYYSERGHTATRVKLQKGKPHTADGVRMCIW